MSFQMGVTNNAHASQANRVSEASLFQQSTQRTGETALHLAGVAVDNVVKDVEKVTTSVNGMYQELLGREAEPGGLHGWTEKVMSGSMNLNEVRTAILNSPERQQYLQCQQPPEPAPVETTPVVTPEIKAQVHDLYQNLMGRQADPEGLQYWGEKIAGGMSVTEVSGHIEYILEQNKNAIKEMFVDILGHNPSADQLEYFSSQVAKAIMTLDDVRAEVQRMAGDGRIIDPPQVPLPPIIIEPQPSHSTIINIGEINIDFSNFEAGLDQLCNHLPPAEQSHLRDAINELMEMVREFFMNAMRDAQDGADEEESADGTPGAGAGSGAGASSGAGEPSLISGEAKNDFFIAIATALGEILQDQANKVFELTGEMSNAYDERAAMVEGKSAEEVKDIEGEGKHKGLTDELMKNQTLLSAESQRLGFMSTGIQSAVSSIGQALNTLGRKQ